MKSEKIRKKLQGLIINFEQELESENLREKVLALIPCFNHLRELGKSLIPAKVAKSARDRILHYFLKYPRVIIKGDELLVISGIQEYARRVRELRTEFGWPVMTINSGRPDLDVGVYLLEADRQSPEHDRQIKDAVKREVLRRDGYKCTKCNWSHEEWNRSDPRHLELHHAKPHAEGGENTEDNLITLCTVCHDDIHRK